MAYGERLRLKREERGLSLRELERLTTIDHGALSRFENNLREPSVSQVVVIARALACSVDELVGVVC